MLTTEIDDDLCGCGAPAATCKLTDHCGCGVPFTLHCPGCEEYMGDEYHRPDEAQATEDKD